MADYMAMIRLRGSNLPSKLMFTAQDTHDAIKEMVRGARAGSTSGIEEWELMEVVPANKGYRIISTKRSKAYVSIDTKQPSLDFTEKSYITPLRELA